MADQIAEMEMETREEPKQIKFAEGDVCEGVLLSVDKAMVKQKPAVSYTVRLDSGEQVSFLGTYQLNRKLRVEDRGHRIAVICRGEDPNVKRGENCMKLFDVKVSKLRVNGVALPPEQREEVVLEITNDDIPF
jgi:hypothetical protein